MAKALITRRPLITFIAVSILLKNKTATSMPPDWGNRLKTGASSRFKFVRRRRSHKRFDTSVKRNLLRSEQSFFVSPCVAYHSFAPLDSCVTHSRVTYRLPCEQSPFDPRKGSARRVRIDMSTTRTEQQRNERKKLLFCSLVDSRQLISSGFPDVVT